MDELVTVEPIQTNNNRKEQLDHSTTFLFFYDKKHVFWKKKEENHKIRYRLDRTGIGLLEETGGSYTLLFQDKCLPMPPQAVPKQKLFFS